MTDNINDTIDQDVTAGDDIDDDQLEEQVSDALGVPEDIDDDDYDQDDDGELVDQDDDDSTEAEDGQPVSDPRLEAMETQLQQMTGVMQNLMSAVQTMQQSMQQGVQQRNVNNPPQEDTINVPSEVEDMSQQDAVKYTLQQAGHSTRKAVDAITQKLATPIQIQAELMEEIVLSLPNGPMLAEAVKLRAGGMPWDQAKRSAQGLIAGQKADKLEKENKKFRRSSAKRRNRARGKPPRPASKARTEKKYRSNMPAIFESADEIGME